MAARAFRDSPVAVYFDVDTAVAVHLCAVGTLAAMMTAGGTRMRVRLPVAKRPRATRMVAATTLVTATARLVAA
jgi:hypothetical protein